MTPTIVITILSTLLGLCCHLGSSNPDAKRLYDDLLKKKKYNKLMRPVANHKDNLTVTMNLKLSQLIDVVSTYMIFQHFVEIISRIFLCTFADAMI